MLQLVKIHFKNKDEKKIFQDTQQLKTIYQQHTTKNVKGCPSSRRKMLLDGNLDPHKGMKSTRNGNHMGKCKDSDNLNGFLRWHQTACQCRQTKETQVQSLGWEDPREEGTATHSSILAWRISWTDEPGRLQSIGSQRVRHN